MEKPTHAPRPELVRLRQRAGLTQQQLADALGLKSVRAVKAWESGTYAPSAAHILPLSRILGASLREVVEAIAGPDHGAIDSMKPERAKPDRGPSQRRYPDAPRQSAHESSNGLPSPALPDLLQELADHVEAIARLVGQLQETQE